MTEYICGVSIYAETRVMAYERVTPFSSFAIEAGRADAIVCVPRDQGSIPIGVATTLFIICSAICLFLGSYFTSTELTRQSIIFDEEE